MSEDNSDLIIKARKILGDLCAAFGVDTPPLGEEGRALSLIVDGRLLYDPENDKAEYTLAAPIKLKNNDIFKTFAFGEPNQSDLEFIHKEIRVSVDNGHTSMDRGDLDLMLARMIIRLGGVASGIQERFKARDLAALQEVFTLFGFFA
jgi:hypothetical protein